MSLPRQRITILFDSPEQLGASLNINDESIDINNSISHESDSKPLIIQRRLIFDNIQTNLSNFRATWNPKLDTFHTFFKPAYTTGCTIITDPLNEDFNLNFKLIRNNKYASYHHESTVSCLNYIISNFPELSSNDDISFDFEINTYDITLIDNVLTIIEYFNSDSFNYKPDQKKYKSELGLFYVDTIDNIDINLSGLRCTSLDSKCQKTMLTINSQQYTTDLESVSVSIKEPIGLHPTISVNFKNDTTTSISNTNERDCEYFMYLQLPQSIFVDKFQSPSLIALFGQHDLELPVYHDSIVNGPWGSESLFKINYPLDDITLHSRYVAPTNETDNNKYNTSISPVIFKACSIPETQSSNNVFYELGLGYDMLFEQNTQFVFMKNDNEQLNITIPVLNKKNSFAVSIVTFLCLILSVSYLLSKLFQKKRK